MPKATITEKFVKFYVPLFRGCLHDHITTSDGAEVLCPFHYELACRGSITKSEICQVWFVV